MNSNLGKLVRSSLFAIVGACAFAGPSGTDPIVGSFKGELIVQMTATVGGIVVLDEQSDPVTNFDWTLTFDSDHGVILNGSIPGTWKKPNAHYSIDASDGETAYDIQTSGDPNAKATAKCKKIAVDANSVGGKILIKDRFAQNMLVTKIKAHGAFGLARQP